MNNYKECSISDFNDAMDTMRKIESGKVPISEVSDEKLYIMYTKMSADYVHLGRVGSTYAKGLQSSTGKVVDIIDAELIKRSVSFERTW